MSYAASSPNRAAGERLVQNRSAFMLRFFVPTLIAGLFLAGSVGGTLAQSTSWPDEFAAESVEEVPQSGQFIADYALQFYGSPYTSAGNGPGGFDCSGFTQYVILNTLGVDIGHDVAGQINAGYWVEWGDWQVGDLVIFAGTYRAGISHVGIYIGDGQFIHAENEGTGVTISSIWSDYYSGHYYGAQRLV